jgi:uncharacterized protein (DUF433 family)
MSTPVAIDLSKYIETRFFEERPHIRDRRVPVATLAYNARTHGWNVEELAYQFTLSEIEVLAALLYYEQHKAEIDTQERIELEKMAEMKRLYGRH